MFDISKPRYDQLTFCQGGYPAYQSSWIHQFLKLDDQTTPIYQIPHFLPEVSILFTYLPTIMNLFANMCRNLGIGNRYLKGHTIQTPDPISKIQKAIFSVHIRLSDKPIWVGLCICWNLGLTCLLKCCLRASVGLLKVALERALESFANQGNNWQKGCKRRLWLGDGSGKLRPLTT